MSRPLSPSNASSAPAEVVEPASLAAKRPVLPDVASAPPRPVLAGEPSAVVQADVLWVREQPSPEHRKLAGLTRGTPVDLAGLVVDGWTALAAPVEGWVATEYLAVQPAASSGDSGDDVAVVVSD